MAIPIIAPFPKRSPFPSPRNKKIKYLYFPEGFLGEVRLSKNLYNEKGRPPYPYKSAKSRDLCVAFCTSQGRGAPLVRWPDGHTFFAFLHRTCPARERSMGAEALRQPLAKTRKSGLSHFFDTLTPRLSPGRCFIIRPARG